MTTETPAYVSPIPADHPSRAFLVAGHFDTDPATMTNRGLVQTYGSLRFESGANYGGEWDEREYSAMHDRAQHLQAEIIRRLGGIA